MLGHLTKQIGGYNYSETSIKWTLVTSACNSGASGTLLTSMTMHSYTVEHDEATLFI